MSVEFKAIMREIPETETIWDEKPQKKLVINKIGKIGTHIYVNILAELWVNDIKYVFS